jgi:hypothetical protein
MIKRGECDLCGHESSLIDGVCATCRTKYGIAPSASNSITTDRMLAVLSRHVGASNGITITQLVTEMLHPQAVDPRELASLERTARELVVQLRLAGHHVCAHPARGYYMAASADELDAACAFLYERAMTSLAQVAAMKRVSLPDLRGQLQLPT